MCGAARRPWVRDGPACPARAAPPPVTAAARAPPCTNREAALCPGSSRRENSCHDTRQQESRGRRVIDQQTAPTAARVSRYTSVQGLREGEALVADLLLVSFSCGRCMVFIPQILYTCSLFFLLLNLVYLSLFFLLNLIYASLSSSRRPPQPHTFTGAP